MISTEKIQRVVNEYERQCNDLHILPTYKGLGLELNISGVTISNIVKGTYEYGKPYSNKPKPNRCVANKDFSIIRSLFI